MIVLTDKARSKIGDLIARSRLQNVGLRIALRPGGCSGTSYHYSIDRSRPDDVVIGTGQCLVLLEPEVARMLEGAKLDYGPALKPPRFLLRQDPNTPTRCPCGRSFGSPFLGKPTPDCKAYVPMEWDQPEFRWPDQETRTL